MILYLPKRKIKLPKIPIRILYLFLKYREIFEELFEIKNVKDK